jgi:RNA polymerase sigma factor (sigma-70 family)
MQHTASQDGEWFSSIVRRYEGPLVRYAAGITGDVEQACDVVQDTFLRLHREFNNAPTNENGHDYKTRSLGRGQSEGEGLRNSAPSPQPSPRGEGVSRPDNVQAWLYTVCRRRALDIVRKETRMKTLDNGQAAVCECPLPIQPAALEQQETENHLLRLLGDLPANQQEVVRLKFQDGLSYRDIAEVTGRSSSNVGYLLHMAVKRLREQLAVSS